MDWHPVISVQQQTPDNDFCHFSISTVFFAFWAFFENRKNSGLTPVTRTWKFTQMTHWPGDPVTQFHVWCLILGSLAHTSLSPISIGASVFAGLTGVPNTQHKRQRKTTDRATFVALGHIYRYAMWLNDESDSMTPTVSRQSRILSVHADCIRRGCTLSLSTMECMLSHSRCRRGVVTCIYERYLKMFGISLCTPCLKKTPPYFFVDNSVKNETILTILVLVHENLNKFDTSSFDLTLTFVHLTWKM